MQPPAYAEADKRGGWRLQVWVQPGAKRDEAVGLVDGRLKVRLRAQAQDNKANEALVAFLAKELGISKGALELASGQASRRKTLRIRPGENPGWIETDEA